MHRATAWHRHSQHQQPLAFRISSCPTGTVAHPRAALTRNVANNSSEDNQNNKAANLQTARLEDLHMAHVEQVKGAVNVHDARPRRRALAAAELQGGRAGCGGATL